MIGTGPSFCWIMVNEVCADIFEEAQQMFIFESWSDKVE